MELNVFMAEKHTKLYTGYKHQSNIALTSALLLDWKRLQSKDIDLDHLKRRPNQLINYTFNLIDTLDHPIVRGFNKDCNSYTLLVKFSELQETKVVVLESPMNDATCALESLSEVHFQVHHATASFGRKLPSLLWESHLINDQDIDHVHYHTIVDDSLNVN